MVNIDEETSFRAATNNIAESRFFLKDPTESRSQIGWPLQPCNEARLMTKVLAILVGLPLDRVDGDDGFHICF